jgi:hypothetical protein
VAQQLMGNVAKTAPDPFANGNPMVAHVYALAGSFAELQACDNANTNPGNSASNPTNSAAFYVQTHGTNG